jgi:iron complex transport system substrate-binding protein
MIYFCRFSLILGLLLTMIMSSSLAQTREMIDLAGRQVHLPQDPQRVVSLAPSITELVYALGREEILKGTSQFSNHPLKAKELPRIGSYARPDVELILGLKPDLVLAIRDGNPRHVIDRLEALKIPVFALDSRNIEEIILSIEALGEILDARDQASMLINDMQKRIKRVQLKVAKTDFRPNVFFQADSNPVIGVGESTFINEIIKLSGGINAIAGVSGYPRLGWEDILRINPEVVIIASMAGGRNKEQLLQSWRRWPQLRAVQNERIHVVDADIFERPTHRLVEGLEILAGIIHPELTSDHYEY